jgi:hypothetical protein
VRQLHRLARREVVGRECVSLGHALEGLPAITLWEQAIYGVVALDLLESGDVEQMIQILLGKRTLERAKLVHFLPQSRLEFDISWAPGPLANTKDAARLEHAEGLLQRSAFVENVVKGLVKEDGIEVIAWQAVLFNRSCIEFRLAGLPRPSMCDATSDAFSSHIEQPLCWVEANDVEPKQYEDLGDPTRSASRFEHTSSMWDLHDL